jgi:hypothetical protein
MEEASGGCGYAAERPKLRNDFPKEMPAVGNSGHEIGGQFLLLSGDAGDDIA